MRIERLRGRSDLLGEVDLGVPDGLVAVVARDDRPLRELESILGRAVLTEPDVDDDGMVAVLQGGMPHDAREARALLSVWAGTTGMGAADPSEVFGALHRAVAYLGGGGRLTRALDALQPSSSSTDGAGPGAGAGEGDEDEDEVARGALRTRIRALGDAPDTLTRLEQELSDLRADHAEVAGDLEVSTMSWLRERQDAETHLQAYRDRARELKVRLSELESSGSEMPCPTCGRVLGDHFDEVVTTLREEWESVVQDGSWWRRRREQLDLKPETLQELEGQSVRLQAAMEEWTERVERARARVHELRELRRRMGPGGGEAPSETDGPEPSRSVARALRAVRSELRSESRDVLLEAASRTVSRLSGGRVLGLSLAEGGLLRLEGAEAPLRVPAEEDRAAAVLALRLAAAGALGRLRGRRLESLVMSSPFDRLDEERQLRVVDELRGLVDHTPQVLLMTRGRVVDTYPEAFDAVLEVPSDRDREGAGRAASVRWLAAGLGTVEIV